MKTLKHFPRSSGPGESSRLRESRCCEPEPGPGRISEKSASGSSAPLPTLGPDSAPAPLPAWRLTLSPDKHWHSHVLITTLKYLFSLPQGLTLKYFFSFYRRTLLICIGIELDIFDVRLLSSFWNLIIIQNASRIIIWLGRFLWLCFPLLLVQHYPRSLTAFRTHRKFCFN